MQNYKTLFIILLATFLLYLPILLNPSLILNRGNDLQEFFWPIFYFVRQQILEHQTFPLWNNLFLSGTPLLPDPQSPLFYPPNLIFLILPINQAFLASFMLHSFFGGVGVYLAAHKGFGLSPAASIVTTLLYLVFPRTAGFLEAGHFGLVASSTWLPFLLLAWIKLVKTPHFRWSALLAVSLTGLFFTHSTTFITSAAFASTALFIMAIYRLIKEHSAKTLIFSATGIFITVGLTTVTLLPQLEWLPQTTRFTLIENRDVYPKWNSKVEFMQALYPHLSGNKQLINEFDTEKWLALGIFISFLALIGFLQLRNKLKLLMAAIVFGVILVVLNNASPIYSLLLRSDWYVLGRVSTRIWFVIAIITIFLAGFGFEWLIKKEFKKTAQVLAILALSELLLLSWLRIERPVPPQREYVPASVYEFLKNDPGQFRVFCVNRCIPQKQAAIYGLELVEGYATLQQKNYYDHFIQLSQVYWDKYTLALPPFEIYNFREIQPYSPEIADYNVKYVISPYTLKDKNLVLRKQVENYLIYENTITKSRAYFSNGEEAPIFLYLPNKIIVDTSKHASPEIVLAEVWDSGWKAYLDGKETATIQEAKSALRKVDIKPDTGYVEFVYLPDSYILGRKITIITLVIIALFVAFGLRRQQQN